ncbi:hypothetical protein J5N97_028995 [Dioscorea zingiberensis]|uniref:Uncharacterized protein n=1 Tax=Dioscorea zingiberensis TaxID=325984 RepID=A0A9D5H5F4_9LILI|nr:hypothetical protein J5N97_028995 [Dioscorea zingiberensis]
MASLANSVASSRALFSPSFSDRPLKSSELSLVIFCPKDLSLSPIRQSRARISTYKKRVAVQAAFGRDTGRPSSASVFVGGFVLGGLIVGALGCIYAPQISKALSGTDKKDLMRKLPKFIYDEEKALEKTRRILEEKIEQLNSAIDGVSSQLRGDETPNGMPSATDEIEAAT